MSIQARRERERAERERMIVTAARELAEAEGWEAVTTRRLADRVEYSQPVLYSHFAGKDAIMAAVAVEGFTELGAALRTARTSARTSARESAADPRRALADVAAAYAAFADRHPALYEVMFTRAVEVPFGRPETPGALRAGFGELLEAVRPVAGDDDPETLTETFWSGLHGLVTLLRNGRLRPAEQARRLALLVDRFSR
jgi:AcrR family transcriptional regulator